MWTDHFIVLTVFIAEFSTCLIVMEKKKLDAGHYYLNKLDFFFFYPFEVMKERQH